MVLRVRRDSQKASATTQQVSRDDRHITAGGRRVRPAIVMPRSAEARAAASLAPPPTIAPHALKIAEPFGPLAAR